MEKKLAIILGVIVIVFVLMVITKGQIWTFLVFGTFAWVIYKNNRY